MRSHTGSQLEEMGEEMTAEIWQGLEREGTRALGPGVPARNSSRWKMDFRLVESGRLVLNVSKLSSEIILGEAVVFTGSAF